jgi:O-antigen ligase/Tfp pilus assembly protein PilF
MMDKKIEKICLSIIRFCSYLILFLPLYVSYKTLYPYIFGKIIVFRILIEIIFFSWLFLAFYQKDYRINYRHPLVLSLTIFIAFLFLTMLTGVDIQRSFWSTQERMTGVLTMIHFWLWFIVLTSTFKKWEDWQKFIWLSLIACFLVGLYGLGQKIGLKFLLKETDIRLSSTLGNPIYLGVYSMLHIFLAIYLFIEERRKFLKLIAIFLAFFYLIIMLLTATRGAFLAFFSTSFLFLVLLIFIFLPKKIKKIVIPIFIIFVLFITIVFIFLQTKKVEILKAKIPYFIYRFIRFEAEIEQRIIPWQIGLYGFKEKPIFGWGWENYNIIFNKYFKPKILRWGKELSWFDRSHNQLIDLLALTGILGFLSYLTMYLIILFLLFKKAKESFKIKKEKAISLTIISLMFLAYFLQNLTVFDTPAPLIVFYLNLSFCYFLSLDQTLKEKISQKQKFSNFPKSIFLFLIILFLSIIVYKLNLEPFQQSQTIIKAISYSKLDLKKGLEEFKKALAKPSFTNPEARLQLAKVVFERQGETNKEQYQEALKYAISELEKNVSEHPLDMRYKLYLGQLYNLGYQYGLDYLNKAENTLKRALELSPNRQEIYFELARTKMFKKDYQEALRLNKKAVELDEKVAESHLNLGLTYLTLNNLKDGLMEIDKAYLYGYPIFQNPGLCSYLSNFYAKDKQFDKAIKFIDAAYNAQPQNLEYLAKKIIIYYQADQKEIAKIFLEKLKEKKYIFGLQLEEYLKSLE